MTSEVFIDYTNYRGERKEYRIRPVPETLRFGHTQYHTTPQWLFDAEDLERGVMRTFAMKDVHLWRPASGAPPIAGQEIVKQNVVAKWG